MANTTKRLPVTFFNELEEYLRGNKTASACAKSLGIASNTFTSWFNEAYIQGYLYLRTNSDKEAAFALMEYFNTSFRKVITTKVASGQPQYKQFAMFAAEQFLLELTKYLTESNRTEINIGIVSGSSVGEMISQLVSSQIWQDIINLQNISASLENINIYPLNYTQVSGKELYGNAIASVVALASFMENILGNNRIKVVPYGIMSPLLVTPEERLNIDKINAEALETIQPSRIDQSNNIDHPKTKLDIMTLGVGSTANSVFIKALKNVKDIKQPKDMSGDLAYIPIDCNGKPLGLQDTSGRDRSIYTLISADIMKYMVDENRSVILIACNYRLFKKGRDTGPQPDKSEAIKATVKGGLCNYLITDRITTEAIMASAKK